MTAPGRIPLWLDLREVPVQRRLLVLRAARAAGVERILLPPDDLHLGRDDVPTLRIDRQSALRDGTRVVGRLVRIRSARDQDRAAAVAGTVVVDAADWKVIPLENLVAMRRDRPGTLFALARSPREALLFRDTLEHGVDGVVLAPRAPDDVTETDRLLRERGPRPVPRPLPHGGDPRPEAASVPAAPSAAAQPPSASDATFLEAARVTAVEDAGPGDRVCVDATTVFADGEGLLVGSTARSFALVHAETVVSEYVAPRPFRVNAGAVHMYVLAAGGRTRYLSELSAGAQVLAVSRDGALRTATVGRAKVERRPHTLVRWRSARGEGHAVLQTAETIRLVRPDGTPVAVTELEAGDEILVHHESAARHFGMAVDEHLEER